MRRSFLLALLLVLAPATLAQTTIGELLRPDGTVDAARAAGAALDLTGFDVSMTANGLRAVPQTASKAPGDWSAVSTFGPGFSADVRSLATAPDGTLYAGGFFTSVDGTPAERIAARDPSTGVWSEVGGGVDVGSTVDALAVAPDGTLYAGGNFTSIGGVAAGRIAAYDPGTGAWSALGAGVTSSSSASVSALALGADGVLHVGGSFEQADGLTAQSIARYNTGDAKWISTSTGVGGSGGRWVSDIALDEATDRLYITGSFQAVGGVNASKIAYQDLTTDAWSGLGSGLDQSGEALALSPDGTLYVGGTFGDAGGVAAPSLAAFDPGTGAWSALGTGVGGFVTALAVDTDGTLYAGSAFPGIDGVFEWDGSAWALADGVLEEEINVLAPSGAGVLAGGAYLQAWDGAAWSLLSRLTPAGDYFLALTHRSHLAVMTAEPIALSDAVPTAAYDFSADDIYLYGANASADLGARVALFAGDGDGNGSVLADDRQSVWLPAVGQAGYLAADFDLNGSVLADDRQVFLDPNVGRASQVPGAANLTGQEPAAARARSRER